MATETEVTLYLVVDHDKHADPEYYLFRTLEEALAKAKECMEWSSDHYQTEPYEIDCSKLKSWHYSAYIEDCCETTVCEVTLK